MRTVHEVSKLTGVSVRTLHYYDAIDLLKPAKLTEAGYRLYDDTALGRLQSILLFRELRFPLKEIREILDSPNFNPAEALEQQITLLELQKKHIEKLIAFAREIQEKGVYKMEFDAFDKSEWNQYAEEVKERWGQTRAYEECEEKMKEKTENEVRDTADQMMEIFAEIGKLQHLSPEDNRVQEKIETLQSFISEHYYTCTKEILSGLGQMYVGDERMKRNIDKAGGDGTAEFAAQAIEIFVH